MKACENYIEKIMESVDGMLSEAEEQALQAHLAQCEGCRGLYESYQNIQDGILSMEEDAPEGLTRAVMDSIRREKEKSSPIYYLKRAKFTLIALAACLVLVVAGNFVNFGSDATETVTTADVAPMEVMKAQPEEPAEAPVAMAEAETALIPAYDGTADMAAEEPAAAEEEAAVDEEMAVEASDPILDEIRVILAALEEEGYTGDLVQLYDMTEQTVFEEFPQAEKLELSSGHTLYRVEWTEFDAVADKMHYGYIFSTQVIGDHAYLWLQ